MSRPVAIPKPLRPLGIAVSAWIGLSLAIGASGSEGGRGRAAERPRRVSQQQIEELMRLEKGYDPTVTTNGPRFQAAVMLRLARQAAALDSSGPPLLIDHAHTGAALIETYASVRRVSGPADAPAKRPSCS